MFFIPEVNSCFLYWFNMFLYYFRNKIIVYFVFNNRHFLFSLRIVPIVALLFWK